MNEGPLALFKEEQMSRSGCGGQGGAAGQLCRVFFRSHVSAQLRRPNFGQPDPAPVLLFPYRPGKETKASVSGQVKHGPSRVFKVQTELQTGPV